MSIRNDIKIVENINATLLVAEKIQEIEKQSSITQDVSLDSDYHTVLEILSIYKDILLSRPFVKVVGQNSQKVSYPDFLHNSDNYSVDSLSSHIQQYKQHTILEHADLSTSVENKYKRAGSTISKYGYDSREPLLPQIKTRITSYLHPTSFINFNTSKIQSVRQQFTDSSGNTSLKNNT